MKIRYALIFISFLFVFVLFFSGESKASYEFTYNDYDISLDEESFDHGENIVFLKLSSSTSSDLVFCSFDSSCAGFYYDNEAGYYYFLYDTDAEGSFYKGIYMYKSGTFYYDGTSSWYDVMFGNYPRYEVVYSNFNIYDSNGDLNFAGDVQVSEAPTLYWNFTGIDGYNYSLNMVVEYDGGWYYHGLYDDINSNYIACFSYNNYVIVYSSVDCPSYYCKSNADYLHSEGLTSVYIFDKLTGEDVSGVSFSSDMTGIAGFWSDGTNWCYSLDNFVWSNFNFNHYYDTASGSYGLLDYDIWQDNSWDNSSFDISSSLEKTNPFEDDSGLNYSSSESNEGSSLVTGGFNDLYNFGFVGDITDTANNMLDIITNTSSAPKFTINVSSKYYSGDLTILDLSWYAPYKEYGDAVICAFAYAMFIWRMFIRLPDIISGAGGITRDVASAHSNDFAYSLIDDYKIRKK